MEYFSASITEVMNESIKVQKLVEDLQQKLNELRTIKKKAFDSEVDFNLSNSHISDAQEIINGECTIIEFNSETNSDIIPLLIDNLIEKAKESDQIKKEETKFDSEDVREWINFVDDMKLQSKASFLNSDGVSFSMYRLAPGYVLFTSAFSCSIQDHKIFDSDSIIATSLYMRLLFSNEDISHEGVFNLNLINKENYIKLKNAQSALLDKFTSGEIDLSKWQKLDSEYSILVNAAKIKMDSSH